MSKYYIKKSKAIEIGNNIKEIRKARGLTQKEIAAEFNFTQQHYSRYESGIHEFSYEQLCDLCKILQTTPNEIFGYDF